MPEIPDKHIMVITKIYPTQDEAVKQGEALVKDGFLFVGEGEYQKAKIHYIIGYDPELPEMVQKGDIIDTRVKKNKS